MQRTQSLYTSPEDELASRLLRQKEAEEYHLAQTRINVRDGSLLRLIPAGEFTAGSTPDEIEAARAMDPDGPSFALQPEAPRFRALLPAFYLGVYAVTNAQFVRFLNESRPSPAQFARWLPAAGRILALAGSKETYRIEPGYERHPALHVSWFGADAYCQWAGLRLPREVEWEKGARGTDGRIFPWGNEWHEDKLRWHGGDRVDDETTAPVDAYPEGCSPYGLFQMAGNVDEWCADPFQPEVYARYARGDLAVPMNGYGFVVRGGTCLRRNRLEFRCAMRRGNDPALVNILYTGFRCVDRTLQWTNKVDAIAQIPAARSPTSG